MPWLGAVISLASLAYGVSSGERQNSLAKRSAANASQLGAASLLEQQDANAAGLGAVQDQNKLIEQQNLLSRQQLGLTGADSLLTGVDGTGSGSPVTSGSSIQGTGDNTGEYLPGAEQILGNQQPNVYSWN